MMAMIAGISEAGGGLLLVLGLFTPVGSAMIIGTMIVAAYSVHKDNGLWATNGGYELPLVNAVVAAGLAFTGAGTLSLDSAFDVPWNRGWGVGLLTVCVAGLAAAAVLARRHQQLSGAAPSDAETYPSAGVEVATDPAQAEQADQTNRITS